MGHVALFLLSAATLLLEIGWTRLFSVAQFYHFAFMILSLAMLGFGASGTLIALFPTLGRRHPRRTLTLLALGYGLTAIGGYALTNLVPFDSFSIAWDRRQVVILVLHYVALSLPFLCSGLVLSLLFVLHPQDVGRLYATNLTGSALGCALALLAPIAVGGEGVVWLSAALSGAAALCFSLRRTRRLGGLSALSLALVALMVLIPVLDPPALDLRISPYKALSYALQYPDARLISQRWNSFSRVDVVESGGVRSLPGLSYRYLAAPPPQLGVLVDADDLNPALELAPQQLAAGDAAALAFTDFLPTAVAYRLRPQGRALVLQPRGGLELWVALAQGAARVTAVAPNPLIVDAAAPIYAHEPVATVVEGPRSFVRRTAARAEGRRYDVVTLALTAPYRPVRSGAYSLAENYRYTVEAFRDNLACLTPEGLFVVTRWVQTPPSESLRAFALAVTAVEALGGDPSEQIVAFRGYAALTLLVKRVPFTEAELATVRRFAADRAFDLVYAPDLAAEDVNRYNVLDAPVYYRAFTDLVEAEDRAAWYRAYPFDVSPPTDHRPFFAHFFKWSQARQVLAELGKQWQPFGGAGYFVLLVMLALALGAAALMIVLPVIVVRRTEGLGRVRPLLYFGLLGLGFLFVEVPLMQRFILYLGHPAYAMTAVLFAVLFFSGVGSWLAHRMRPRRTLALLVALVPAYALGLSPLFRATLGLPLAGRALVAVLGLAPVGVLMGMPFPQGLRRLAPREVPWAWAANGALSVVSSVLSALLALSLGFGAVLVAGALCYAGAWLAVGWPVAAPTSAGSAPAP